MDSKHGICWENSYSVIPSVSKFVLIYMCFICKHLDETDVWPLVSLATWMGGCRTEAAEQPGDMESHLVFEVG